MKTIKRKNATMSFRKAHLEDFLDLGERFEGEPNLPRPSDGRSYLVSVGRDEVALVTYVNQETSVLVTQLFVYPTYRKFGIGTQILELLGSLDGVTEITVLATPSSAGFYEKLGFESVLGYSVMSRKF